MIQVRFSGHTYITDVSSGIIKFNKTLEITFNILDCLQFDKTVLTMYIREYDTVGISECNQQLESL